MKTISVLQLKGGAGRSTLATNLAGALAALAPTVLLDADLPQGTGSSWFTLRAEAGRAGDLQADAARDYRELISKHERHAARAGYMVIDGPPRLAEMTNAALMLSDVALVPMGTSLADVWATGDLLAIIEEARQERRKHRAADLNVRIVWSRYRAHTRLAQDLTEQTADALKMTALRSVLGLRVAYAEALGAGLTVEETGDALAREELRGLMAEVRRILR